MFILQLEINNNINGNILGFLPDYKTIGLYSFTVIDEKIITVINNFISKFLDMEIIFFTIVRNDIDEIEMVDKLSNFCIYTKSKNFTKVNSSNFKQLSVVNLKNFFRD